MTTDFTNSGGSARKNPSLTNLEIRSSQILTLIQHHLTESGLTSSSQALLSESTLGSQGLLIHAHANLQRSAKNGDWGQVLEMLTNVTLANTSPMFDVLMGQVHEMAILELGDLSEIDLAFATLRTCGDVLEKADQAYSKATGNTPDDGQTDGPLSNSVERRLHALAALRSLRGSDDANTSGGGVTASTTLLPPDFYGPNGISKEKRRSDIAKRLGEVIPIIPSSRLVSLLQQAIKWQVHTGEFPMVRDLWQQDDLEQDSKGDDKNEEGVDLDSKKKRKKSKQSSRQTKKRFDLVLGEVDLMSNTGHESSSQSLSSKQSKKTKDRIPLDPYSVIKFSKKTAVTSATFFTDSSCPNDASLVTGSSDGFIEIWDSESKYTKLRTSDLKFQKEDELMCHFGDESNDSKPPAIHALAVNPDGTMLASGDSDGTIQIWNIQSGKCLRTFDKVHAGAITCLDFSRDGEESSRILSSSQDGTCREFGLRTRRMLKEFQGHGSFVNTCAYALIESGATVHGESWALLVVTASADGTVRIWDGRTAEVKHIINPFTMSKNPSNINNKNNEANGDLEITAEAGRNVHTVLALHTPASTMIIVPRGPSAFLMSYNGDLLQTYTNDDCIAKSKGGDGNANLSDKNIGDFVAAAMSPTNKWLYCITDDGVCLCFDVSSGKIEKRIKDFGIETTDGKTNIEISGVVHHPLKGMLAAYSSSKDQKRGLLTLWK